MLKSREPGSAITHFIAMLCTAAAALPLLLKAYHNFGSRHLLAMSIFIGSMILLYGSSTAYHSVNLSEKVIRIFRKIDHMMIFVLIAGSYTPICMLVLEKSIGYPMLLLIWLLAAAGILMKACWITCPKWFSSMIYIAMGWVCVFALSPIRTSLPPGGFYWLLAGGIIYTLGGILYALKLPIFRKLPQAFGSHEIFHLFVMGGSACHFILMYQFLAAA